MPSRSDARASLRAGLPKSRLLDAILFWPALVAILGSLKPGGIVWLLILLPYLLVSLVGSLYLVGSRARLFLWGAGLAVVISVFVTRWPLHAAYRFSRPAFERTAAELRAGRGASGPRWVGLFRIQRAELDRRDIVCLWTDLDSSGRTGFVQCGPVDPPFNLWSHTPLDDEWQLIEED